jgi:hypothetical protein
MKLTKAEKSVLLKAAEKPIAGMELSREERMAVYRLKDLDLIYDFGQSRRMDLKIIKTKIYKCAELLQTVNSESSAENPT